MRRLFAFALLLAFVSPLALPLFAATADPQASLPACCRMHGKHHCSMMMAMVAGRGPVFTASPCPSYPTAVILPRLVAASLTLSPPPSVELLRASAPRLVAEYRARTFVSSANLNRGPPPLHPGRLPKNA